MHQLSSRPEPGWPARRLRIIVSLLMLLLIGTSVHGQSDGGPDNEVTRDSAIAPGATDAPDIYSLRETGLEQSPKGRELLTYLIGCALPAGVTAHITVADHGHEYPGSMGLAPGWLQGALTETEERWLSACLYARTNHFGIPIQISMRAEDLDNPALIATAQERQDYTIFEGGFFGNLFAPGSPAYVCSGDLTQAERADRILTQRVCTQASGSKYTDGRDLSRCGFVLTGPCSDPASLRVDGESYSEVTKVYLKPQGTGVRSSSYMIRQ